MTAEGAAPPPRSSTTPTTTPARWRPRPGALNPYKLGIELFRDIEERWNKGQLRQGVGRVRRPATPSRAWDKQLGLGRQKIFEVRTHLQRHHLHRHVPHRRVLPSSRSCSSSASTSSATAAGRSSSREFKKVKKQAARPADQLRPAVHLRRGRQLREPRRAAAAPTSTTGRISSSTTPGRRCATSRRCGTDPATSSPGWTARASASATTGRTTPRRRSTSSLTFP